MKNFITVKHRVLSSHVTHVGEIKENKISTREILLAKVIERANLRASRSRELYHALAR